MVVFESVCKVEEKFKMFLKKKEFVFVNSTQKWLYILKCFATDTSPDKAFMNNSCFYK